MGEKQILHRVVSNPPDRVVVDDQGLAVPFKLAQERTGKRFPCDVIFVRGDGWALGASNTLKKVAHRL